MVRSAACATCHDPHGKTSVKRQLRTEVRDAGKSLCAGCHTGLDIKLHTEKAVGVEHDAISCVDCHATTTMQTGAGAKGLEQAGGETYWMNDIHLTRIRRATEDEQRRQTRRARPGGANSIYE